jgi:hypothetical protein
MDDDSVNVISELDELGLGGGGIPMVSEMRRNLRANQSIEEARLETRLGIKHALSSIKYYPKPSKCKVKSTGEYLTRYVGSSKNFDPLSFYMSEEAKEGVEAREKTLSVDFVVAKPVPPCANEAKILPGVESMLAKCYNKFLFIGRCMENGDEKSIWTTIKDGILSTAYSMKNTHDLRMRVLTGSDLYSTKNNIEEGMVRERVKERLRKVGLKKESFFREGGGSVTPLIFLSSS